MFSIIKELWIFSKAGIPIIEIGHKESLNKYLMGSFISAIKSYSESLTEEGLTSFILEKNKYILKSSLNGNALVVCRSDPKIKEKKIKKICNLITQIFEDLYKPEDIENWDGDVSFFDNFRDKLDLYFKMSNL
ncbi:MAG: hypothetical protein ACFFAO_05120 [Candidatus Hermodarchaeota archaeon]